jgi:hypothetical protein
MTHQKAGQWPVMIDRTVHVKDLKTRVAHTGYEANARAVAEAMLRQATLRAEWRRAVTGYKRCS